jgi:hypothetical protein
MRDHCCLSESNLRGMNLMLYSGRSSSKCNREILLEKEQRKMKTRNVISSAVLIVLLSLTGWAGDSGKAADSGKATIRLYQPATVGSTELAAGEYKITWQGTGPQADVTFSQGKKAVVTVPAQVAQERSGYSGPVIHTNSKTKALLGISLPKVSLTFNGNGASATGN